MRAQPLQLLRSAGALRDKAAHPMSCAVAEKKDSGRMIETNETKDAKNEKTEKTDKKEKNFPAT
eukprot:gene1242-2618_t